MILAVSALVCVAGAGPGSARKKAPSPLTVAAMRQALSTDHRSTVAHDTETMAIVAHAGRLFAATDQWEYSSPSAAGQVLVKRSRSSPWTVFEHTKSLRVQALDSFPIPSDQGLGSGHSLLITQAIVDGRSRIQWLLDRANSFRSADSFVLSSNAADVRAFGVHESRGVWSIYAGVSPTGILRGTWSPRRRTLVFSPRPELSVAPPRSPGLKAQKVTGFADCAGALYVSINTRLFRRNDSPLAPGTPRWSLVYRAPPVGPYNSGLRGLTCVTHHGSPALLVSTEGTGYVYRFGHLPRGRLHGPATAPGQGLHPVLEFSPIPALRHMLAAEGTPVPATGKRSIGYVIAAYNNFESVRIGGVQRQLFGIEHAYVGGCPPGRRCGPTAFGAVTFDSTACFAVRTDRGRAPTYTLRCLSGRGLDPVVRVSKPIRSGQALVSIRTIVASPFADGRLYYGGYDCNFYPADGTAWIATSTLPALHLTATGSR